MITGSSQKTISKTYQTKVFLTILEIILLAGIGAIGVLLHAKFRFPLRIPGHWGLIYMAILVAGRLFSKKPYASSLSSIGAATMLLLPLGFKDPFMPFIYMFPGFLLDTFYYLFKKNNQHIIIVAFISGVAYCAIPLIRILLSATTGIFYGSFIGGFFYPVIMHIIFGAAGGILALFAYKLIKKKN